jgi:hypothetical protein
MRGRVAGAWGELGDLQSTMPFCSARMPRVLIGDL